MESRKEETDDPEYQRAFTALHELKLASLKPFFKEHFLQDDTLFFMESEEELRNFLVKELKLPFGQGFKFSRHWFHKYHKTEEAAHALASPEVVPHFEKAVATKEVHVKSEFRSSPSDSSGTSKKEHSPHTITRPPTSGTQVTDEYEGLKDNTKVVTQRHEKKEEDIKPTKEPEDAVSRLAESPTKEPEDHVSHPAEYVVAKAEPLLTSCGSHQKPQEWLSETGALLDEESRIDEPGNKRIVAEISQLKVDIQDKGEDVQHNMAADVVSFKKHRKSSIKMEESENSHEELPSPLVIPETVISTVANKEHYADGDMDIKPGQTDEEDQAVSLKTRDGAEENTDEKVTNMAAETMIEPKSVPETDQLQQETDRIEQINDDACVNSITNQRNKSVEKIEDANDTVIRDDRKDTASENSPASSVSEWETLDDEFEDATDRINQIENDLDVTTLDYENQITNETSPNECQNQSNKGIVAKESVQTKTLKKLVHDWFEDKTCGAEEIFLTSGKTELQDSLSESMDLEKEESHHSHAKKRKRKSKTKVKSSEKTEKRLEEQAFLEDKSLQVMDSDPCPQENEPKLERKQEGATSVVLEEDQTNLDINNNFAVKLDSSEVAISANIEPIAAVEESSLAAIVETGKEVSVDNRDESGSAFFAEAQIDVEASSGEHHQDVCQAVNKCTPRPLGVKGKEFTYQRGFVLDAEENREVEFKSLTSAPPSLLPWKIMEKGKKFICACLNADRKGIIYFGVGDSQEQCSKFKRGEILGLNVEDVIDDIVKAFQFVLDDHIKSDDGPLQKGGEQNCVNLEFVPVMFEGSRANLYVIEIEVLRDWKFCKDHIYYSKCWTEKRGVKLEKDTLTKKALSDLYKVHKDEFDDVAIRTNGSSTSIKQHEVNRQVKEPLMVKYKEWKREAKVGANASTEDSSPDDSDVKRFSSLVRERLRDMNFKDFGYVLIANKLPPQYRGTPQLAFLQNIPWLAVFDLFDAASKKDGLHYVCNETTDAPRAKLRTLDDFKEVSSDWINGKDFNLSTRGTTWILNNEEMQKGNWIKCSRHCFYQALSAYKDCCPPGRLLCVFLGLDENGIHEMVDMMECCFSILGNSANSCVTVISESKSVAEAFIKASRLQRELRECSITGIPWKLLKEIVREMVGPTRFEERGATTELPYFTGELKEVLNKVIHSWDDLEVYSPNPRLPRLAEDIEKERNAFYKGAQASQINLFHNHCIPRTLEEETNRKVKQALKALSKPIKDINCHVKTVTVPYEPGSGATTLCRRILWNKRNDFRCAVVKAITPATDYQIEQLQGIIYDENKLKFAPPCLVLVDNFPENETRRLTEKVMKRKIKCVLLSTFPIAKLSTFSDYEMPLRQLDETEMSLVKGILINITSDSKRRRGAQEVLEREKRFIWFGLELFGRNYDKIEERLQNHIKTTLDFLGDSQEIHETVLNFCCFLHYYSDGRAILPHPVVSDFLYEASNENEEDCILMEHIHKIFGGLLLEGFNETNGYYGWRPAHSLVSEVVTSRINIEDTAVLLLDKIYKGKAYVNKFLKEQVLKVFLDRKRISDPVLMEGLGTDDGSIDSDFESEVVGFYEVRTRYSPLIVEILEGDNGIQRALRLLITICQKASQTEEKAYAWQQLARFMGYEMRANEMDSKDDLHCRLHTAIKNEQEVKLPMPATGIEAAHMSVDIAISQQPNYSHHYVTKGTLYLLQLRDFKPNERSISPCSMSEVIDICRKALVVYDKALSTTHILNLYSMIGKIQAIISLLEIVKGLSFFRLEGESITRYLKKVEIPREMEEALTPEEHKYVQGLSTTTLDLLNELFRDMKLRQMTTYDETEIRGLNNAKIRASKLRRNFYEVTGFDRSELSVAEVPMPSLPLTRDAPALYQQIVQDILFRHDETPYSTWANLADVEVSSIYKLLKVLCQRGFGSHDDILICCKACLRLKERPPVEELDEIVNKWVSKYPNSEWAHLFNYMIHFPIPNGSLATFSHSAKESIKKCDKIVRDKTGTGFRKSGAEYFLGKGIGLYAIASSQEFPSLETKWGTKTDFWRSKEISEKLERVCGQKDVNFNGVITYQGIQLRFDNTRYPYQSKDDLWFYVGFSVAGPYAYDPVDTDKYAIMRRKADESAWSEFPLCEAANGGEDNSGTLVSRRVKFRELKKTITTGSQKSEVAPAEAEVPRKLRDVSHSTASQAKQPISSSMPHFLNMLPSAPAGNSRLSPSSLNMPAVKGMSSWVSIDSLHRSSASSYRTQSYASALQLGSPRREDQLSKNTSKQLSESSKAFSGKSRKWKTVEGSRGKEKQLFEPKYVDKKGRLHHGAFVRGAKKSKECKVHTNETYDINTTTHCGFAHPWRGDTLQYVCNKCTLERGSRGMCQEKSNHESFIWNLGPYYNEDGTIWKDRGLEHPK